MDSHGSTRRRGLVVLSGGWLFGVFATHTNDADRVRPARAAVAILSIVNVETKVRRGDVRSRSSRMHVDPISIPIVGVKGIFGQFALDPIRTKGTLVGIFDAQFIVALYALHTITVGSIVNAKGEAIEIVSTARHNCDGISGSHDLRKKK